MSAAMTMKLVRSLSFSVAVLLAACAWAQDAPSDTSAALPLDTTPPAPATDLDARDYVDNSDAGDKIAVTWALSPDDGGGTGDVLSYQLWRSGGVEAEWDSLGTAAAGATGYLDESAEPGVDYYYGIAAFDGANYSERVSFGPVAGRANFFQRSRMSVLVLMAVFFGMVLFFTKLAERGAELFVRRIPGLNAIEEAVGRATEMGRPVLYVPGIGEIDNIMTIASLTILSHVAKITARYETPLIVPTARAVVMSAAEEVVKEAYAEAGKPDSYNPDNIRYLSDAQFAFAGAGQHPLPVRRAVRVRGRGQRHHAAGEARGEPVHGSVLGGVAAACRDRFRGRRHSGRRDRDGLSAAVLCNGVRLHTDG